MAKITLGRTGLQFEQCAFGALPIQRISKADAVKLVRRAYDGGMEYFDTARGYTDSEEKLGEAFAGMRNKVLIASKTTAKDADTLWKDLHTSLTNLKTDHIDVYQLHNPAFCPRPGDESSLYDALLEAKKQGKIRFISITNHRLHVAKEAVESGLYDTLQFPFSYLSGEQEKELVDLCFQKNMGFIAMKALSGGLITHARAAYAWIAQQGPVVPIFGIQRESELDDFLSCIPNPPELDEEMQSVIEADRSELCGDFCRGCGYCMPCPAGIEINLCARITLLLRRSPTASLLSEKGQKAMFKVEECLHCNQCIQKCPYQLNTPELLQRNLKDYKEILAGKPL